MKARLLDGFRIDLTNAEFVEVRVWIVPAPVPGSTHLFKYSYAFIRDDVCVLRYDNERGKGDHRHWNEEESRYAFTSIDRLATDFWRDVREWRIQNRRLQRR